MSEDIAKYSFLPFVRQGLSADITEVDHLGTGTGTALVRASVTVEVRVNSTAYAELKKSIQLIGPGDITGIQSKAIVRCNPPSGTRNFEPNYLPYIDFYEEDFLWRYTPAKAKGNQLRPWLLLLVLKEDEFERQLTGSGPLSSITLTSEGLANGFPDVGETWAWAHVHVNADLDPSDTGVVADAVDVLNTTVEADASTACCRLLSTRRLEALSSYTCFLVPAFETGRLAGLGQSTSGIEAQKASFGGSTPPSAYPYYHSWSFHTGEAGDFESLVEALEPRAMNNATGRQPIDIQKPGYGITYASGDGSIELEGALRVLGKAASTPLSFTGAATLAESIRQVLDLSESLLETTPSTATGSDASNFWSQDIFGLSKPKHNNTDPVVTPPLYGCWHAQVKRLDNPVPPAADANWLHQLNLDPSLRAAAGLGAEVVRRNQETYMQMAWEQVGDVMAANAKLRAGQLAKEAAGAIYRKHLLNQSSERLFGLTAKFHPRVMQGSQTMWQAGRNTKMGTLTQSAGFRKLVRPSGPLMKRVSKTGTLLLHSNLVKGVAAGTILATVAKKAPTVGSRITVTALGGLFDAAAASSIGSTTRFATPILGLTTRTVTTSTEATRFKTATSKFSGYFSTTQWPAATSLSALSLTTQANTLRAALNPATTIPQRMAALTLLGGTPRTPKSDRIDMVMACPKLFVPTYEPLVKLSSDYMLPNLKAFPDNSISLLEVNQPFIEAYLAGMNHEMMRELLWREYPTDQRGTVFQYFWDGADYGTSTMTEATRQEKLKDIKEMHQWAKTAKIGGNSPRSTNGTAAKLVLVIRGELLRRYPNTMITAVQAQWSTNASGAVDMTLPRTLTTTEKQPLFSATVSPDITLIGFDLTAAQAHGMIPVTTGGQTTYKKSQAGWFFVLEERAGEVRFGLDEPSTTPTSAPSSYAELNWGHLSMPNGHIDIDNAQNLTNVVAESVKWGKNAANMAYILYQDPVRVAVHAADMMHIVQ